jgi:hypothetical protein
LKDINKILKLQLPLSLSQQHPAEPCLLRFGTIYDGIEIKHVIIKSQRAIFILVKDVKNSGQEGLFPSQQSKSLSELIVVHSAELSQLLETFGDDVGLFFGKVCFLIFADFLS